MKDNLLKKFLSFSYGNWIGLVIGVLTTMITTRILSPEHFGKASMYNLALNMIMIFVIFGMDQPFVRFFYEEKEEKRGMLLYNCLKIPIILMTIIVLVILIFRKGINEYLFEEDRIILTISLIIGIIFSVFNRYSILVIRMKQKGHLYSILEITRKISDFILIIGLFFLIGNKYETIIYSTVITTIILTIVSILLEKESWKLDNLISMDTLHTKLDIFKFAYPLVLTTLIHWLFTSFDKIALKRWSTFTEIGLYSGASRIVALLTVLQSSFTTFWTPVCYDKFEKDTKDTNFFAKASKIITMTMLFLAILSIMGKDIIVLLLGNSFKESSNIMPFLVFMPIMYTVSETTVIGINFHKKTNWHILISGTSCIVNIIGNGILVPSLGAKGAAISTAFAYIVFFTLRTFISLKYYIVDYGLKKLYIMLTIISIYALYSTFRASIASNIIVGFLVLIVLFITYINEIRFSLDYIYKNIFSRKIGE